MAKISELPLLETPEGDETVPVLVDGVTHRAPLGPLASAAMAPPIAAAQAILDNANALATELANRLAPLMFLPGEESALNNLLAVQFFTRVDGVDLAIPELVTVREFANDVIDRFRMRLAGFDGDATYTPLTMENEFGSLNQSSADFAPIHRVGLYAEGDALGVPEGSLVGYAWARFDGEYGIYWPPHLLPYSEGALQRDKIVPDPAWRENVSAVAQDTFDQLSPVWAPHAKSPFLHKLVRSFWAYGIDKAHRYGINKVEFFGGDGGLNPYARIYVHDLTEDDQILVKSVFLPEPASSADNAIAEFVAWANANRRIVKLTDETSGAGNQLANALIDWSALTEYGTLNFSDSACEIAAENLYDIGDEESYFDSNHYQEAIAVAAGANTLAPAIVGLQMPGDVGLCERAHFHHRPRLKLGEGTFYSTYREIPDYCEIEGMGRGRTIIRPENGDPHALIEGHFNVKAYRLTLISTVSPQYAWHYDGSTRKRLPATLDQNRTFKGYFEDVEFLLGGENVGQGFGSGLSSGDRLKFVNCRAGHESTALPGSNYTAAGWFFHNSGPTGSLPYLPNQPLPARVEMVGCGCADDFVESVYMMTLDPSGQCELILTACDFAMIRHEVASSEVRTDLARDRVQWRIASGDYMNPFQNKDPEGNWVLEVPIGTELADDAADLFGGLDELGRGEKYVGLGDYVLGKRLGNCAVTPKTVTLDGVSKLFETDQRGLANATILAAINAVPGMPPVTLANIALEWYPDIGGKRRMRNTSGVRIPKGRYVKRTARGEIALAQPGDRIFGWTFRDILPGLDGDIVRGKAWFQYIEGATENAGAWGLAADGLFSTAAVTKIGDCIGGTVELW